MADGERISHRHGRGHTLHSSGGIQGVAYQLAPRGRSAEEFDGQVGLSVRPYAIAETFN